MDRAQQIIFGLAAMSLVLTIVNGQNVGYVVSQLTVDCVPLDNKACPDNTLVPKPSLIYVKSSFVILTNLTEQLIDGKVINQTCRDSVFEVACLGIPTCTTRKIIPIDVTAAVAACEKGKTACPETIASYMLNCTKNKETYDQSNAAIPQLPECKEVKDSTGTCPDIKYKLPVHAQANYPQRFQEVKQRLEAIKPKVTSACYEKVSKTACHLVVLPCTDDEKYMVSLISKQDCVNDFECAKAAPGLNITETCGGLPDANTAKKVPPPRGSASSMDPKIPLVLAAFFFSSILQ